MEEEEQEQAQEASCAGIGRTGTAREGVVASAVSGSSVVRLDAIVWVVTFTVLEEEANADIIDAVLFCATL